MIHACNLSYTGILPEKLHGHMCVRVSEHFDQMVCIDRHEKSAKHCAVCPERSTAERVYRPAYNSTGAWLNTDCAELHCLTTTVPAPGCVNCSGCILLYCRDRRAQGQCEGHI